jgi:hypothetical protein
MRSIGWKSGRIGITAAFLSLAACSAGSGTKTSTSPQGIGDGEIPGAGAGNHGDGSGAMLGASDGASAPSPSAPGPGTSGGSGGTGGSTSSTVGGNGSIAAGILTAGSWDDNRNFDLFTSYLAAGSGMHGRPPLTNQEYADANALWSGARASKTTLDVSLVIDTTGSMGDELRYLTTEFLALHAAIGARYPDAEQRWSLVVYKDVVDEYIVRWFDFRDDPNDFVTHLAAQTAGGGGDYPESPERALGIASQLGWRDDAAKLAFWVADAPHHDADAAVMATSIRDLRARGVHVYPVMASAADDLTELTMRSAAELTGGRLLFLTDDSGVGDTHAVPRIPCFFVTKLDKGIERMVDIELSGTYREPDASDVIRTGGDPQSGRCTLDDGHVASVF